VVLTNVITVDFLGVFWLRKGLLILTWRCFSHPHILFGATSLGRISKGIYPNIRIIHMVGIIGH
jgi:hypothetical protein